MENERYIVEKTWANTTKLVYLEDFSNLIKELGETYPVKRYFKLPELATLEEVSIEVLVKDLVK